MNITRVLSTAMLFWLPGTIATGYAQEHEQAKQPAEHQQAAKPAQQKQQAKPAKQPAARQQAAKPAKPEAAREQTAKPAKQPAARQQAAKPAEQQAAHQQAAKPAKQQAARRQTAKPAQQQQKEQASRGQAAAGHGSIPEAKFRSSFGSGHTFHVNRSEFANGSGRFQYGGYWFNAVNPWPVGWLYTDNVYVDYLNGGYFLCDPLHPGVYISINIG
jgi:outer membrane biosynthesis protein TonB